MMEEPKRIVIAGMPRCGTTLLASLLNQQPSVRFVTDYANWLFASAERLEVGLRSPLTLPQRRVALAVARDEWVRLGHPVLVSTDAFTTLDALHTAIARELRPRGVVGHKTLLEPPQIRALLDHTEVHVVIMLRDPRAAALSYWHRVGGQVESYLGGLREMVRFAWPSQHSRLRTLRFEDLVARPLDTLGEITAWWGAEPMLPDEVVFARARAAAVPWSENSAFGDVDHGLSTRPINRWTEHRGSPLVRYASVVCRTEIDALGYPPSDPSLSDLARFTMHDLVCRADRRAGKAISAARQAVRGRLAPKLVHREASQDRRGADGTLSEGAQEDDAVPP